MKREWILGLATAAGMSLLTALPVIGGDKNVSNIKKPSTDASKPVVIVSQQPVKGTKLSAKTTNPTTDVKKSIENKTVTAKPVVDVKPAAKVSPVTKAKPSMKIQTVASVKPASDMKAMPGSKTVTAAKPATPFVKPVVETKPVANVKTSVNAKPIPSNEKPAAKPKTKPVLAKPIAMSKPAAPIKLAINTKPIEKTKPLVTAKPAVSTKLVNAKPVVDSKPAVQTKTVVDKKSAVNVKPAVESKPAAKSIKPAILTPKKVTAKEPIAKKADKPVIAKVAPIQRTNSFPLPAGWERINLSNDQREKAMVISDKYSAEIKKMEAQLEAAKANRQNALSALLTQEQRNQFVNSNGQIQQKPTTNGKAKSEIKKAAMINRVSRIAAVPIELKKGRTQK
jgi:hypothetical protein